MRTLAAAVLLLMFGCGGNGNGGTGGGSGGSAGSGTTGGGSGTGGGTAGSAGGGTGGDTGGGAGGGATGGGAGGGAGGGMASITLAQFCGRFAEAKCARLQRCSFIDPANLALCTANEGSDCVANLGAANAGVFGFDGAEAASCVAELNAYPCTRTTQPTLASCRRAFPPAAMVGQPCTTGGAGPVTGLTACAQGFCAVGSNLCSTCVAYQSVGQACNGARNSGATQRCDPANGWCPPADAGTRTCQSFKAPGSACAAPGADPECADSCVQRSDGGQRCGFLSLGEPCLSHATCGPTAWCRDLVGARSGVCTARIPLSSPCTNQSTDDGCSDGGTCLDGTCVPAPFFTRTIGQECDSITQCVEGSFCRDLVDPATDGGRYGVCAQRITAGSGCGTVVREDDPCVPGSFCPFMGPNCVPLGSTGAACSASLLSSQVCKSYLDCFRADAGVSNGVCRLPADAGQLCGYASGNFLNPAGHGISCGSENFPSYFCARDGGTALSSGVCIAPRANGAGCTAATECASRRCVNLDGGTTNRTCQAPCF